MPRTHARGTARDRLLDAAEELFVERGIAATGVDAVLGRAEVSPATLYAHFPGKDHLVAGYLERRHERWRATWDAALERCGDDPDARVLAIFDALDDLPTATSTRGCAFLAAAVEVTEPEHPAYRWLAADTHLLVERLRQLAAESGAADPDALAAEILGLYDAALASRTRRTVAGDGGPAPLPCRALAASAVVRHRA